MKGELLTLPLAQEGPDVHNCSEPTCPARQETQLATGTARAQRGQASPAPTSVTVTHLTDIHVLQPQPDKILLSPNQVLLLLCDQMATSVLHPIHADQTSN